MKELLTSPELHDVVVNVMALGAFAFAFVILGFMQNVTRDMGVRNKLAALQLAQRVLYVCVIASLAINAIGLLTDGTLPPLRDALVEGSLFLLTIVSYVRHLGTPKLPKWTNWNVTPQVRFEVPAPKPNGQIHAAH